MAGRLRRHRVFSLAGCALVAGVLGACHGGGAPPAGLGVAAPAPTSEQPDAAPPADGGVEAASEAGPEAGPPPVPLAVTAGDGHTCALVAFGSQTVVYCWGANDVKQLGADGKGVVVAALPASAGPFVAVRTHASAKTTCALDAKSEVWCWGANDRGQVGTGPSASAPPTRLAIAGVPLTTQLLAVGARHACMTVDGSDGASIACWGDNSRCELGLTDELGACAPDASPSSTPGNQLSTTRDPSAVALGADFGCARSGDDGKVRCWGANDVSQCAEPASEKVVAPVEVTTADAVVAGVDVACALTAGATTCWGNNAAHAVSDDALAVAPPTDAFTGIAVASLAAGKDAVCVIDAAKRVHCRGTIPGKTGAGVAMVDGVERVTALAVGNGHVCVVGNRMGDDPSSLPNVLCWGTNDAGQANPAVPGSAVVTTPTVVAIPSAP